MIRLIKLILLTLWVVLCFCIGWSLKRLKKIEIRDRVACLCFAGILRIIGVRLKVHGRIVDTRPLLVVTNHLSYLDIPILGSVFPFRFTPKHEIGGWPGIGALTRVIDGIFVERKPEKMQDALSKIRRSLASGNVVCLFPEATTGNGLKLLPFKSGMFSMVEEGIDGAELAVQPAAIIYTRIRKLPLDMALWPDIAWYGDMALMPHLWKLLGLGRIDAELVFLPVANVAQYRDRKLLSQHCQEAIAQTLEQARQRKQPEAPRSGKALAELFRRKP